jgi:hypothetical protein
VSLLTEIALSIVLLQIVVAVAVVECVPELFVDIILLILVRLGSLKWRESFVLSFLGVPSCLTSIPRSSTIILTARGADFSATSTDIGTLFETTGSGGRGLVGAGPCGGSDVLRMGTALRLVVYLICPSRKLCIKLACMDFWVLTSSCWNASFSSSL